MGSFIARALRNPVSALGVAVTTAAALLFLFLAVAHFSGYLQNPYLGILVFILVPAVFVVGLLLIPVGFHLEHRREVAGLAPRQWPTIDLNQPVQARMALFVVAATFVNVVILSMASYGAVEYSDSTAFCGQVCHTVMKPEFQGRAAGPHANIECAACHIGPGAGGFVSAKFNGTRQLWLVATNSYPRPIPTPIANLPAPEATCLQCHDRDRFIGDKIDVIYEHANDAANKETVTKVTLHVGGPVAGTGSGVGIHWHMNQANKVEYVALDDKREEIPYVKVTTPDGRVREFFADKANQADLRSRPLRAMDCLDCHSRPAHRFGASAAREVDAAMGLGLIPAKIPFIRREAVRALNGSYPTQDAGIAQIDREIRTGVNAQQPHGYEEADLRRAIGVAQGIYRANVFPEMKVGWGTYPNQLGHTTSNGCFRCHDDSHKASDGAAISMDCDLCHTVE